MHMFDEPVLRASGVGKIYSRHQSASRERIGRALLRATIGGTDARSSTAMSKEFWSLKDVNLTVKRGEAVGILGLNGAGKTTLLRILAGQLLPDAGEIEVVGRTASMIDLTAGFQVTASGRENIYLRGAALGRSRAEIDASVDEIIAFTELCNRCTCRHLFIRHDDAAGILNHCRNDAGHPVYRRSSRCR